MLTVIKPERSHSTQKCAKVRNHYMKFQKVYPAWCTYGVRYFYINKISPHYAFCTSYCSVSCFNCELPHCEINTASSYPSQRNVFNIEFRTVKLHMIWFYSEIRCSKRSSSCQHLHPPGRPQVQYMQSEQYMQLSFSGSFLLGVTLCFGVCVWDRSKIWPSAVSRRT